MQPRIAQTVFATSRRIFITSLNAQIPNSLYKQVEALATQENISIDQLVAIALAAQVSAWATQNYLEDRASRGSWGKFQQVLEKVPDVEPKAFDR